ncbi:MAG: hypothetical protein ACM3KT_03880 [Deltaproteobacteria bacterium]
MTARVAIPLTIGVTSHRNLVAGEIESIRHSVRDFLARMRHEYPHMPLVVVSALAEGGDQLVAEEALAAGARLIAPLPLARAQYAEDFTDAAARARFNALCDAAQVLELPQLTNGAVHAPVPTGYERDRHYAQAGVYVSDHCHILLAIWDGKPSALLGGTAQIVRYRLSGEKPALAERRRATPRSLLDDDSERLAYHIVCSRDQADGAPASPLHPLQTCWRSGDRNLPGDGAMPDNFRAMLARSGEFNADADKRSASIAMHPGLADDPMPGTDAIDRLFRAADWLAIHFQRRVLLAMRGLYTVAALMAIAFTAYDNLPAQDDMIYVFLLLFALGGFLVVVANRRGWHRKYLDYRALAEGLRVQWYWRRIGISLAGDAEFARDNFLQKQDVELGWVRDTMRSAELDCATRNIADAAREMGDVVREWVGDARHGGQLDYYRRKAAQRARTHRFTEAIDVASLCVGIAISIVLAAFAVHLSADTKNDLVVVMAVFSIVAGVRAAYAYKKADKELIKQYRYMQRIFGAARKALDRATDAAEQREILRLLGEAALAEQVEWALMHRQRPLEHNRL